MSTVTQDQATPQPEDKLGDQAKEKFDSAAGSIKGRWLALGAETRKTVIYAGTAVVCLVVTAAIEFARRPKGAFLVRSPAAATLLRRIHEQMHLRSAAET
jgi:hypothetical protein